MMLPGSTPTHFSFVLPESTLLYSSQLAAIFSGFSSAIGMTLAQFDSTLKWYIAHDSIPPQPLLGLVDEFASTVYINVHIAGSSIGDVFKYMTVRYSRHFGSKNVNLNPSITWVGMLIVNKGGLVNPDSVAKYPSTFQFLYNAQFPDSVRDTILIDTGYSYFVVADSGINGTDTSLQIYSYYSLIPPYSLVTDTEELNFEWFYSNLDNSSRDHGRRFADNVREQRRQKHRIISAAGGHCNA